MLGYSYSFRQVNNDVNINYYSSTGCLQKYEKNKDYLEYCQKQRFHVIPNYSFSHSRLHNHYRLGICKQT